MVQVNSSEKLVNFKELIKEIFGFYYDSEEVINLDFPT